MTGKISATEGALRRGAEAVVGAHGDIAASVRRVQTELNDLASLWQGDAAKAYSHMLTTWNDDAHRLNAVLVALEEALRATERDQVTVEAQNKSTIAGLNSMMAGGAKNG